MNKIYTTICALVVLLCVASCTDENSFGDGWLPKNAYEAANQNKEPEPEPEPEPEKDEISQASGTENGYGYVDLGLSVMWATCNIGALTPESYGDYFAWGETKAKDYYEWGTYFDSVEGSDKNFSKYAEDKNTMLDLSDDAAHTKLGGNWRMPTQADLDELKDFCTTTWMTYNGVGGIKITSRTNGNSIFLPAAGIRNGNETYDTGNGYYWLSTLNTSEDAYELSFGSNDLGLGKDPRFMGEPIRAVFTNPMHKVRVSSITITASEPKLSVGETLQLSASISPSYATNKSVTWSTSDATIATISSTGLVTAHKEGSVTITATANDGSGVKATYTLSTNAVIVTKITVTAPASEIFIGDSLQLSATVSPTNATNKSVIWSTSDATIATVSPSGLVTSNKVGSVTITATAQDGSGVKGTVTLSVKPVLVASIAVTADKTELIAGETLQLSASVAPENATNKSIKWSTSDASVATVSSTGLVTTLKDGSVTITATAQDGSGVKGTYTISVKPVLVTSITISASKTELFIGETLQLSASVSPSNATNKSVTWSTSNTSVATVSSSGLVTAVKEGNVTIKATAADGSRVTGNRTIQIEEAQGSTTTGTAAATGIGNVGWVQLWTDGPKFAEYNVGVTDGKAESYGGYYCWGSSIDKDQSAAYKSGTDPLTGTDDTATNLWGNNWRMPTKAELEALLTNCDVEWTTVGGVNGRKFTGKVAPYTSNSVFLPAAGCYGDFFGWGIIGGGIIGDYWSSTPNGSDDAYHLDFGLGGQSVYDGDRLSSYSVRAVLAE